MKPQEFISFVLLSLMLTGCQKTTQPVVQSEGGRFLLGGVEAEDVVERAISPEGRALEIKNENGHVTVRGTDGDVARFFFQKYASGADLAESRLNLDRIKIEERGSETTYFYTVKEAGRAKRAGVDVVAEIPAQTPVSLILTNSEVLVQSVRGPLSIENKNGSITILSSQDEVTARTENGHMHMSISEAMNKPVLLETKNGSIEVFMPRGMNMRVEAETDMGEISAEGLYFKDAEFVETSVGARYRGTLGAGSGVLRLKTRTGNIYVGVMASTPEQPATPGAGTASDEVPLPDSTVNESSEDYLFTPPKDTLQKEED